MLGATWFGIFAHGTDLRWNGAMVNPGCAKLGHDLALLIHDKVIGAVAGYGLCMIHDPQRKDRSHVS